MLAASPSAGSSERGERFASRAPRFRLVGRFERIAQLDGVWRDTALLELRL
jgi:L-amino acid N-acyltransferase YncA